MSEESKNKAIELLKEAAKDVNDKVGELNENGVKIPFLSSFFSLIAFAFLKIDESKFEDFMNQLRIYLAFGNTQHVAELIAANADKKWMQEGLARGWRLGLETFDETARKCAYQMVADYLAQEKIPDRLHRQFANLFMDADPHVLNMVLQVGDILTDPEIGGTEIEWLGFVLVEPRSLKNVMGMDLSQQIHMFYKDSSYHGLVLEYGDFYESWEVLQRHSLASVWIGEEMQKHPDNYEIVEHAGILDSRQIERLRKLHKYLKPHEHEIFMRRMATKSSASQDESKDEGSEPEEEKNQ